MTAVAPATFGRYGGDLVALDEKTGRIVAIDPGGHAVTVVESHLPAGSDIGVESAAFVPPGLDQTNAAYLADRRSPGNPHRGRTAFCSCSGCSCSMLRCVQATY